MNRALLIKATVMVCAVSYSIGLCGAPEERWSPPAGTQKFGAIDEGRGNWYYKREYYRQARDTYGKLRSLVDEIDKTKNVFFQKRSDSDAHVTQFNHDLGFEQGEVDELLDNLTKQLEAERERKVELTENERKLLEEVRQKKKSVEQLKEDFKVMIGLDDAVNQAMGRVLEKVSEARGYEQKSWHRYTQIAQEINDRKAEQLFHEMQTDFENAQNIATYLTSELTTFFDAKIEALDGRMSTIRSEVGELKARGVELAKKVKSVEQSDIKQSKEELQKLRSDLQKEKGKTCPVSEAQGWWQLTRSTVGSWFTSVGNWFKGFFVSPEQKADKIKGVEKSVPAIPQKQEKELPKAR